MTCPTCKNSFCHLCFGQLIKGEKQEHYELKKARTIKGKKIKPCEMSRPYCMQFREKRVQSMYKRHLNKIPWWRASVTKSIYNRYNGSNKKPSKKWLEKTATKEEWVMWAGFHVHEDILPKPRYDCTTTTIVDRYEKTFSLTTDIPESEYNNFGASPLPPGWKRVLGYEDVPHYQGPNYERSSRHPVKPLGVKKWLKDYAKDMYDMFKKYRGGIPTKLSRKDVNSCFKKWQASNKGRASYWMSARAYTEHREKEKDAVFAELRDNQERNFVTGEKLL